MAFVPLGVFVFGRRLTDVYGEDFWLEFVANVFGVHRYIGIWGYNPTWWYMTLLVGLYLVFPIAKGLVENFGWVFLFVAALLMFCNEPFSFYRFRLPHNQIIYFFPFVLGIFMAHKNGLAWMKEVPGRHRMLKFLLYLVCFCAVLLWRVKQPGVVDQMRVDGVFALLIIAIGFEYLSSAGRLGVVLELLGKHSFNIFLFHTFFYKYFFPEFIYAPKSPVLIFLLLLAISLITSVLLEKGKRILGFPLIEQKVRALQLKEKIVI